MYLGDEAYDAALHYFEVMSLNRPDVQGGPKRYFRHLLDPQYRGKTEMIA